MANTSFSNNDIVFTQIERVSERRVLAVNVSWTDRISRTLDILKGFLVEGGGGVKCPYGQFCLNKKCMFSWMYLRGTFEVYKPTSSWWTTAAIQRCSQTTPKDYTHHRRHLGGSCTRSTTVEASHSQRKESY